MTLLDGKKVSTKLKDELKQEVSELKKKRYRALLGCDFSRRG